MYIKVDTSFVKGLSDDEVLLLKNYRKTGYISTENLLEISVKLQDFLVKKFNIKDEFYKIKNEIIVKENIFFHRQNFIQRLVLKKSSRSTSWQEKNKTSVNFELKKSDKPISGCWKVKWGEKTFTDEEFCILLETKGYTEELQQYADWAIFSNEGQKMYKKSKLFNPPSKINAEKLFNFEQNDNCFKTETISKRDDFNLSTLPPTINETTVELNYCLYCHERHKDTCRTGFNKKENDKTPNGCPLNQKISEMNLLAKNGDILAAISVAMIDNPFLLLTGNRICNDCIKGCIFQVQTAVDVPLIESGLVDILLKLPSGFEIYYLLTQWNPLKQDFMPEESNGKKILVCGMGPAGIALSYCMLRKGYEVVGIDAMKIKDLAVNPNEKIIDFALQIETVLEKRKDIGFGGVMEHGITARWNKNFLTAMHVILKRNPKFSCKGNTQFGKDIDLETAQKQGFCYVGLCVGSGLPKIPINFVNLPKGVFNSKDFLIDINTQNFDFALIESPVVILGSGLTAVDCSTEAIICLKKTKQNYDVKIVSRGKLVESVAYNTNHEEIRFSMETGAQWLQGFSAENFVIKDNKVAGILDQNNVFLEAKTVIIAIGTELNKIANFDIKNNEYIILDPINDSFCIAKNSNIAVGIFGDLHPLYRGTVVKALASAKDFSEQLIAHQFALP